MRRAFLPAVLAVATLLLTSQQSAPQAAEAFADEYRIKAAFLFNFAKFIQWPAQAYQSDPAHQVFCIFGSDPFGAVLDHTLAGKRVEGRSAVVRRVQNREELRRCQLVFVAAAEGGLLPEILTSLGNSPVLLVGDDPDFVRGGGAIGFVLRKGHVRFAINPKAAQQARLKIDAQLLDLAEIVKGKP